jgi:hypothetical protein
MALWLTGLSLMEAFVRQASARVVTADAERNWAL